MVDAYRAEAARTLHLRPVFECRTHPNVLAVATTGWRGVVDRRSNRPTRRSWILCVRLGAGSGFHVSDQSLRSVRTTTSLVVPAEPAVPHTQLRNAGTISTRPASALRGLAFRFLEHTHDDARAPVVRNRDDRLHP